MPFFLFFFFSFFFFSQACHCGAFIHLKKRKKRSLQHVFIVTEGGPVQ